MTTTTNFGFNIPDGTDNVNLLTQNYPNWTLLDAILKAIKDTGVTTATATKTSTNFAVVRNDTDCNFFRFVATANYVAGDTFTVDGVPVTATSAAGTALPSGAFVINQSVIAIVNSGVLTVLVGGGLSSVDASDVDYDNAVSGLAATDVQAAIDELKADIPVVPASYPASDITYDNTVSGLAATDVQNAIDEIAGNALVHDDSLIVASASLGNVTKSCIKFGKLVLFTFAASVTSSIGSGGNVFTLASGNEFKDVFRFIATSTGGGFVLGTAANGNQLNLASGSIGSGLWIGFSGIFELA